MPRSNFGGYCCILNLNKKTSTIGVVEVEFRSDFEIKCFGHEPKADVQIDPVNDDLV